MLFVKPRIPFPPVPTKFVGEELRSFVVLRTPKHEREHSYTVARLFVKPSRIPLLPERNSIVLRTPKHEREYSYTVGAGLFVKPRTSRIENSREYCRL